MTYNIGDMIVHPLHGAGAISEIQQKRVDGKNRSYYVLMIPRGDMRVMIPTDTCEQIGIRPIIPKERAEEMGVTGVHISLSGEKDYAAAFAVLEGEMN